MYFIPSFIVIPVVLIALFFLNRQHNQKNANDVSDIVQPTNKGVSFEPQKVQPPPSPDASRTPPITKRKMLTAEQRLANEAKIKKLQSDLKRIQENKLNLKKGSKKR